MCISLVEYAFNTMSGFLASGGTKSYCQITEPVAVLVPPMATIPLADVEEELRKHLEAALEASDGDDDDDDEKNDNDTSATNALAKLSLKNSDETKDHAEDVDQDVF